MLTFERKALYIALPTIAAVGVFTAIVMGGAPERREATIAAGTSLVGALENSLSTEHARVGDVAEVRTVEPIQLDDGALIPSGAVLHGEVTHAKRGGRIAGAPELTLRFATLEIDGQHYDIASEPFRVVGKSDAEESAMQIGGGAVAGGLVGAVTGGNAATGAVVGAAIGTGVAVATKGDDIVLAAGQRLHVILRDAVTVQYRPAPEDAPTPEER